MYTSNKLTLAIMLGAIGSLLIAGVSVASVNADINNPKGDLNFKNTRTVIVNLKAGKDGQNGKDGVDGQNGKDGINGRDGINGNNGTDGQNGADGKNGTDGQNGRDGQNGIDGINGRNGTDGRDGQMVLVLNVTNGQHIVCSADAGGDVGCVDTSEGNGTVIIPPVDNGTGTNDTGGVIPPVDNGTGTGTNDTGGVIPPVDNGTTVFDNGTITNENGTSTDTNDTG